MPLITGGVVDRTQLLLFAATTARAQVKTMRDSCATNFSALVDPFVAAVAPTFEANTSHARLTAAAIQVQVATAGVVAALVQLDTAARDLGTAVLADGPV